MRVIHWLDDKVPPAREELGGKGYGLAVLAGAGMPVPAGFVVTAEACAALGKEDDGASGVLGEIASAWSALSPGGEPVAVRSSAVDEDSETASFAGLHETVLGVTGREQLLDAIERSIASAEGEAATAYREQRSATGGGQPRIAVVVQRMVSPNAAGVAFSVDPVTGADDAVVIEAVAGTAERLVGGEVTGYRAEVTRADRAIRTADGSALELLGEDGVRAVAALALEAEELFGAPQDIEWAWADGEAWILQSRAVTTTASRGEHAPGQGWVSEFDTETDDKTVWTSANVQEVLPGLLTPLSMSIYRESSRVGYNVGFQKLGMLASDEWQPFMGTFYNRAFLNLSTTRMLADRGIGTSAESVDEQYLAGERGDRANREPFARRLRFKARSAVPLLRMTLSLPAAADRMDRSTQQLERDMHALDPGELSNHELIEHLDRVLRHGASIFATHLQVSGTALFGFEATRKLVEGVLGDETDARLPALFSGMRNVESAAIGLDLWNLAVVAKNTGIADRLADASFDPEDPSLPDGWRAAWRQFIHRHGHRGMNEMEASARSWRRYPEQVLPVIRGYLELPEDHAPPAIMDRQERERLRLTAEIASKLNPVKRRVFRKVLSDAQGWVALRERTKSVIVRAARIPDHFLPEIQRRLVAQGAIDDEDDVFFLTRGEIETALTVAGQHYLQDAVARRRAEYERNSQVRLPERFQGHPAPLPPDMPDEQATVLHGTPVSAGIVTAKARVVLDPMEESGLQPGEILVAPVTDAGWTPLFALAGGLIVDLGSALSHGSTVAREYGLPAVVNVHNGTRVIKTGDLVTVNGSAGTVSIAAPDETEA